MIIESRIFDFGGGGLYDENKNDKLSYENIFIVMFYFYNLFFI